MERYSLFDVQPPQPERAAEKVVVSAAPENGLRFPPEDAGASLAEIAQRDLAAALQLLCERAQYITAASGAAIALRDIDRMVCCASAGPSAPELGAELTVNSGLSGESVRTRQILRCDNAETDSRVNRQSCRALGIASVVVLPVVANDNVIGVFELFSSRPFAFEERDIIALQRLAEMIQTALEQADAVKRGAKEIAKKEEAPLAEEVKPEAAIAAVQPSAEEPVKATEEPVKVEAAAAENPTNSENGKPAVTEAVPAAEPAKPEASPEKSTPPAIAAAPEAAKPAEPAVEVKEEVAPILPEGVALHFKIGKCASCGFPVSEGRTICIDCEKKAAKEAAQPEEAVSEELEPSWLRSHAVTVILLALLVAAIAAASIFYLR